MEPIVSDHINGDAVRVQMDEIDMYVSGLEMLHYGFSDADLHDRDMVRVIDLQMGCRKGKGGGKKK